MIRLPTENTSWFLGLIRTVLGYVAELPTVVALQSDVVLGPVPLAHLLLLHVQQVLVAILLLFSVRLITRLDLVDGLLGTLCEVFVTFEEGIGS